jgi:hypothetical protein
VTYNVVDLLALQRAQPTGPPSIALPPGGLLTVLGVPPFTFPSAAAPTVPPA